MFKNKIKEVKMVITEKQLKVFVLMFAGSLL